VKIWDASTWTLWGDLIVSEKELPATNLAASMFPQLPRERFYLVPPPERKISRRVCSRSFSPDGDNLPVGFGLGTLRVTKLDE